MFDRTLNSSASHVQQIYNASYNGNWGVKKGKVHPCTGTEAMYRPYGP